MGLQGKTVLIKMASNVIKLTKAQKDAAKWEKAKYILDKLAGIAETVLRNPIFSSMAAYATVHFTGNLKKPDGSYYMHEAVVRTLKGVAAAYPIFQATRGGTAGVIAGTAAAAAVAIAADRPDDVTLPDFNDDRTRVSPEVIQAWYQTTLPLP